MGVYRAYTMKRAVPVITEHCCSKCGSRNVKKQFLKVESHYNDKGAWGKKTVEKRESAARKELDDLTKNMQNKARHITADSDFYHLDLDGRCSSCGNVEPWGKMRMHAIEIVYTIGGVIGIFSALFFLLALTNHTPASKVPALFVGMGIGLAAVAFKYLWILIQKIRVKKLAPESLPHVMQTEEEVAAFLKNMSQPAPVQPVTDAEKE